MKLSKFTRKLSSRRNKEKNRSGVKESSKKERSRRKKLEEELLGKPKRKPMSLRNLKMKLMRCSSLRESQESTFSFRTLLKLQVTLRKPFV
jgi:hypothetical protein